MSPSPRPLVTSWFFLGAALASIACSASPPRPTARVSTQWTLTMLGGECTLSGEGEHATAGSCAVLGSLDLRQHPRSRALGEMVTSLAHDPEAPAGGWPAAQLAIAGAPSAAVSDAWVPIARELKSVLRAQPSTAATTGLTSLYRWDVATSDDACRVAGQGDRVLAIDCPGISSAPSNELAALTTWARAATLERSAASAAPCALATELAAPYPLSASQCRALTTILGTIAAGSSLPPDPMNKLDASASLALARLSEGESPTVEVLLEWTAAPADRDRIVGLGGTFMTTDLRAIQGLRIPLRALPAAAALPGVTRIELSLPLGLDVGG